MKLNFAAMNDTAIHHYLCHGPGQPPCTDGCDCSANPKRLAAYKAAQSPIETETDSESK